MAIYKREPKSSTISAEFARFTHMYRSSQVKQQSLVTYSNSSLALILTLSPRELNTSTADIPTKSLSPQERNNFKVRILPAGNSGITMGLASGAEIIFFASRSFFEFVFEEGNRLFSRGYMDNCFVEPLPALPTSLIPPRSIFESLNPLSEGASLGFETEDLRSCLASSSNKLQATLGCLYVLLWDILERLWLALLEMKVSRLIPAESSDFFVYWERFDY
jgi:hypothetical protein